MAAGDKKYWLGGASGATTTWSNAANWSTSRTGTGGNAAPADGEIPVIPSSAAYDITGLDTTAAQFRGLIVEPGCTVNIGAIGNPLIIDLKDDTTYYDATLAGTGTIYVQTNNYKTITVTDAGASPGTGLYALNITGVTDAGAGAGASVTVSCETGTSIALAPTAGNLFETAAINVTGGDVYVGAGVTANDGAAAVPVTASGGTVISDCPLTVLTAKNNASVTHNTGAVTTANISGATLTYNSAGTLTTLNLRKSASADFSKSLSAKTVTTANIYESGTINDPNKVVVWTNGILLKTGTKPSSVNLTLGSDTTGTDITVQVA